VQAAHRASYSAAAGMEAARWRVLSVWRAVPPERPGQESRRLLTRNIAAGGCTGSAAVALCPCHDASVRPGQARDSPATGADGRMAGRSPRPGYLGFSGAARVCRRAE
jgi:hypothetical protein